MPFFFQFFWDGENDKHIAEHGVTVEEFEFVVLSTRQSDVGISRSTGRPFVIGETGSGKVIGCVYEVVDEIGCYPITAFEV